MHVVYDEITRPVILIQPDGRLDSYAAPLLRQEIIALIEEGHKNLVIDLQKLLFLDSAGIAVLVNALRRTRQAGGDTKLVSPLQSEVLRMFALTKFDRIFEMTDTAEEAIQLFQTIPVEDSDGYDIGC